MAVYRLHRKEWERGTKSTVVDEVSKATAVLSTKSNPVSLKRKAEQDDDDDDDDDVPSRQRKPHKKNAETSFPSGGRKGVSSGLKTIVTVRGHREGGDDSVKQKTAWWKSLPSGKGSKG